MRINALAYGVVIRALLDGNKTAKELAEISGMNYNNTLRFIATWHTQGIVYVESYKAAYVGHPARAYSLRIDKEVDAKRPEVNPKNKYARYRMRQKQKKMGMWAQLAA